MKASKIIAILLSIAAMVIFTQSLTSAPAFFTANVGQINDHDGKSSSQIKYILNTKDLSCYFFNNKVSYIVRKAVDSLPEHTKYYRYDVVFANSRNDAQIIASDKIKYELRYVKNTSTQIASNYEKLTYRNIYPNIDVEFKVEETGLKYNIVVHPGGDPSLIKQFYDGVDKILKSKNELTIQTKIKDIYENLPEAYSIDLQGKKTKVQCDYEIQTPKSVGYLIGNYDKSKTLVIDPVVKWSTYLGGSDKEIVGRVDDPALDQFEHFDFFHNGTTSMPFQTGGIYVTKYAKYVVGSTFNNSWPNGFPLAGVSWSGNDPFSGNYDIFLAVYSVDTLLKCTYILGGTGNDFGMDVVVKSAVETDIKKQDSLIYIVATSNTPDFTSITPRLNPNQGGYDVVLIQFAADDFYVPSFYIDQMYRMRFGGTGNDIAHSLTMDNDGNIAIVGETVSSDFPLSYNPAQSNCLSCPTTTDAFFTRINVNRVPWTILYSTFIGGSGAENALDVEFQTKNTAPTDGYFYVVGATKSINFPRTHEIQSYLNNDPNGLNTTHRDGFVYISSRNTNQVQFSSYFGGADEDVLQAIDVPEYNNFFVTGGTKTVIDNTPFYRIGTNTDPFWLVYFNHAPEYPMIYDQNGQVIIDQNTNGNILVSNFFKSVNNEPYSYFPVSSTIFGGSGMDIGNDIKVTTNNKVLVLGTTESNNFPLYQSMLPMINKGVGNYLDAVALKLSPDLRYMWTSLFRTDTVLSGTQVEYSNVMGSGISYYKWPNTNDVPHQNDLYYGDITFVGESGAAYLKYNDPIFKIGSRDFTHTSLPPFAQDVVVTTFNEETKFPTYLGTTSNDFIQSVYNDGEYTYVTGKTQGSNLPLLKTNIQSTNHGDYDIFVTKYDMNGNPVWSIIYGGTHEDCGMSITKKSGTMIGGSGGIFITGYTESDGLAVDNGNIPQNSLNCKRAAFVMKLEESINPVTFADNVNISWFTYMGNVYNGVTFSHLNNGGERIIFVPGTYPVTDKLYVAGYCCNNNYTSSIFNTNTPSSTYGGGYKDGFIAKLDTNGALVKSRYLGGNNDESCLGLTQTFDNSIGLVGFTNSSNLPVTDGSTYHNTNNMYYTDGFFTDLSSDFETIYYSTYFGDDMNDTATCIYVNYFPGDPTHQSYSHAFIGGHREDVGMIKRANLRVYKVQNYTTPLPAWGVTNDPYTGFPYYDLLDKAQNPDVKSSYCYGICGRYDTTMAIGNYMISNNIENSLMGELYLYWDLTTSRKTFKVHEWTGSTYAYIVRNYFFSNVIYHQQYYIGRDSTLTYDPSVPDHTKHYWSNTYGRDIALFNDITTSDGTQFTAVMNTTCDSLINLPNQNYLPYQPGNKVSHGSWDGLIAKLQFQGVATPYFFTLKQSEPELMINQTITSAPTIFPDPADAIIKLHYSATNNGICSVKIFNLFGDNVLNYSQIHPKGEFELTMDIGRLPVGSYSIESETSDGISFTKFIKK